VDVLNSPIQVYATPRRSTTLTASAVAHVVIAVGILAIAQPRYQTPQHRAQMAAFVDVFVPPQPPPPVASKPLRLPPEVKEELKAEVRPVEIDVPVVAEAPAPRVEPRPAPEPRRDTPVLERPKPAPPVVTVGAFAPAGESHNAVEQYRVLQAAGFDAPAARSPQITTPTASVGAFEQSAAQGRVQAGTDRPNVVGDAGFGGNNLSAGPARQAGRVADAGFGSGAAVASGGRPGGRGVSAGAFQSGGSAPARVAAAPSEIKATDFDTKASQTAAPVIRQASNDKALEILAKPTPVYTDEARALRIEGEVLLEVEFTAAGEVHVLRVVRGLGHGLDESAVRAVQAMRFKPAQRNGQPVDFRTVVNVVFHLA
jgi:TonB family protein